MSPGDRCDRNRMLLLLLLVLPFSSNRPFTVRESRLGWQPECAPPTMSRPSKRCRSGTRSTAGCRRVRNGREAPVGDRRRGRSINAGDGTNSWRRPPAGGRLRYGRQSCESVAAGSCEGCAVLATSSGAGRGAGNGRRRALSMPPRAPTQGTSAAGRRPAGQRLEPTAVKI
jgi:hypothetical protein